MVSTARTVAVVSARGRSKTDRRNNIRLLGEVPLLAYSIEAGLRARLVDQVIVSTDDEEIAEIGRAWGADVAFVRAAAVTVDATPDLSVFQHIVDWLEAHAGGLPEILVHLRPTSPLRPPDCVDAAIELLWADDTLDSVRAVIPVCRNPNKMWRLQLDGTMASFIATNGTEADNALRQELPQTYWHSGHVDVVRASVIRERASTSGSRIRALVLDPAYACDLDSELDWKRAGWLLDHLGRPVIRPGRRRHFPNDLRLVVFDFDGVMTDNRVWVGEHGDEWVACNRSDGLGLEQLRRLGVECFVLSTETHPVVAARCRKLGLPFEHGVQDKADRFRRLIGERGLTPLQVVYVGNDVNDVGCLRLAGCGVAVADAHPDAMRVADITLTKAGGHGAVRELCDRLVSRPRHSLPESRSAAPGSQGANSELIGHK